MIPSREIPGEHLSALAIGAGILGTGGGTHPYLELLNLRKLHRDGYRPRLVDVADLDDDTLVAEIGFMGAPLVSKERLPDPAWLARPLEVMESFAGIRFAAIMSSEAGGENGLAPLAVAARKNLPLVDADPRGRAFPEMQMSSFAIAGLPLFPAAFADIRANEMILARSQNARWTERIGRRLCIETGAALATCRPPRTGRQIKDNAVIGSVSRAIRLGVAVADARRRNGDPVDAILATETGRLLATGKVIDVERRTTGGFVRGSAMIAKDRRSSASPPLIVDFQNEFAIARYGSDAIATVPDLICILDRVTGEAIGTETIRYGLQVAVLLLPAPSLLTTPKALQVVGPAAFGHDLTYRPQNFTSEHTRTA